MIKKLSSYLLILFLTVVLFACTTGENLEAFLNEAAIQLELDDSAQSNIELPLVLIYESKNIALSWSSSHPDVISETGLITRPSFETGDILVTLTVRLSLDGQFIEKTYDVLVIKMPKTTEPVIVSFDVVGGTPIEPIILVEGSILNALPTSSKAGYTLEGFYYDQSYTIPYQSTDIFLVHTTLYVKWVLNAIPNFSVFFESNGGNVFAPIIDVKLGQILTSLPTPIKDGFTFIGWYTDSQLSDLFNINMAINDDLTLYAKWSSNIEYYSVSFDSVGGSFESTITNIERNTKLISLPTPIKDGYDFLGWYIDDSYQIQFDIDTAIDKDYILYAKWEPILILEGTPIYTAAEFNDVSNDGNGIYYIANDIDFSNHTWIYKNSNFSGSINGNHKTLSNITISGTDRTGLFSRVNNFEIFDLTIENPVISSTNRAGVIFGENDRDNVLVRNITIINPVVNGASSNGVGGLVGYTKTGQNVTFKQITIEGGSITNSESAVGALIGMTDSTNLVIEDIFLNDITVYSPKGRVGGLFGEIKGTPNINVSNIVMNITIPNVIRYAGFIVGRNQIDTGINVSYVFLTGEISGTQDVGMISGEKPISSINSVYASEITTTSSFNRQSVLESNYIEYLEDVTLSFWTEKLSPIALSDDWIYTAPLFRLKGGETQPIDTYKVTIELGHGQDQIITYIKTNTAFVIPHIPSLYGFRFIGLYLEPTYETILPNNYLINSDQTFYAKWEALLSYTVTIDARTFLVLENDLLSMPDPVDIPGKIFVGYYLGDDLFNFNTPITTNLFLESRYVDATSYTVTFETNGGNPISPKNYFENDLVDDLPIAHLEGSRFVGWYIDELLEQRFDLSYLVADITLYAKYALLGDMLFEDDFDYVSNTLLKDTLWHEAKPGVAYITNDGLLRLEESVTEATYEQPLDIPSTGRFVLVYDFIQGIGGASFTIELLNNTTRIFTVGANRQNRFTYRNTDGSETAIATSVISVSPNTNYQVIVVFDTEFDYYKYFIKQNDVITELTPQGGISFLSSLDINKIRIRTVGHAGNPSTEPFVLLNNLFIESSSETVDGKSIYDPEAAIDFEQLVLEIKESLTIPFMDYVVSDLYLSTNIQNVNISWVSLNPSVITNDGKVTRDLENDIYVTMLAILSKGEISMEKSFEVVVKSINHTVIFEDEHYYLSGFALNHVSIPNLKEGDPGYYVVYNELDFLNAIIAENTSSTHAARIIEIRADLNLGYNEVTAKYGSFGDAFTSHALPKMHPILKQTGVGKVVIQDRDGSRSKYNEGLVIFSETGHTIKHAAFQIKRSNNIVIRNLKFDELWEWDEATKGDYDSNDWDYFTLEVINGIWFDHIELGKAYDGLIDFKAGSSINQTVKNATISNMRLVFEPNAFILAQFEYLEANRSSYNYYNQMRLAGMTMSEIMAVNSFQKKGFLLGGSELRAGNVFTLTIYNSYIKNLQDRFPRLRGGDVHIFNSIYDATDVYNMRNKVRSLYPALFAKSEYNRQLTNQALVTTEQGAILMENTIIKGVSQVIKSNQVSRDHPTMTGKYMVLNSLYVLDDYVFFGSSEDENTPYVHANAEPKLEFSFNLPNGVLPYTNYTLIGVNVLENYLSQGIIGTTDQPFDWLNLNGKPID